MIITIRDSLRSFIRTLNSPYHAPQQIVALADCDCDYDCDVDCDCDDRDDDCDVDCHCDDHDDCHCDALRIPRWSAPPLGSSL